TAVARDLDLAFCDHCSCDIEDNRCRAPDRSPCRDRIGREAPVAAAMRRDKDTESRRIGEMDRCEPRVSKLLGPRADAPEVAAVADRNGAKASLSSTDGRKPHCLLRDHLAVAKTAVDHDVRLSIEHDLHVSIREQLS